MGIENDRNLENFGFDLLKTRTELIELSSVLKNILFCYAKYEEAILLKLIHCN